MSNEAPNHIPWPPILTLLAIIFAAACDVFFEMPWIPRPISDLLYAVGWVCIVAVVAIDYSAVMTMRRARTTILPTRASAHLVTNGPFSFSRNPIYLGNALLIFGIGLIVGSVWYFVFGLLAGFLTSKFAIAQEEKHLAGRFGKKYHDYARRVRRWI